MGAELSGILDKMTSLRVAVLGDAILDCYLQGISQRMCREAPVPTVQVTHRVDQTGGAANVATNLAALGADVVLFSALGDDCDGEALRELLSNAGVDAQCAVERGRRTLAKRRIMASSQMLLRYDEGHARDVTSSIEDKLLSGIQAVIPTADALVVSDYGGGVITRRLIGRLSEMKISERVPCVVDSHRRLAALRPLRPTAAKPNFEEAIRLLDLEDSDPNSEKERTSFILAHQEELLCRTGAELVAVTLDVDGAMALRHGQPPIRLFGETAGSARTTGAGDTFLSALTVALAAGADAPAACQLATAAAGIAISKTGTATCSLDELREKVCPHGKFIVDHERLAACIELRRRKGNLIAFTNGCFDLLHPGHVKYLEEAKRLGDVLVVALNTDDSIRRLKGPSRPINTLEDRLTVLSSLACVDYVTAFGEDTCSKLIEKLRPDVFVKGGDYAVKELPEARVVSALGGEVKILPVQVNHSTSGLIHRIQRVCPDPATTAARCQVAGSAKE